MSQLIKPVIPRINWSHPLSKGLLLDVPLFEGGGTAPMDLVSKKRLSSNSGVSWAKSLNGIAQAYDSVTGKTTLTTTTPQNGALASSIMFIANPSSVSQGGTGGRIFVKGSSGFIELVFSTTTLTAQCGWSTTSEQSVFTINSPSYYDKPHIFVLTYSGVVGEHFTLSIDGIPITRGSGTNSSGTRTADDANLYIGNRASDTARGFNGGVSLVRFWNRVLNSQEIKKTTENPWSIYKGSGALLQA